MASARARLCVDRHLSHSVPSATRRIHLRGSNDNYRSSTCTTYAAERIAARRAKVLIRAKLG